MKCRAGWSATQASHPRRRSESTAATASGLHLNNADVISMPDKWEYPWYAAWGPGVSLPAGPP